MDGTCSGQGLRCDKPEETQQILADGHWLVLFFHGNAGDRRGRVDYCQVFNGARADVFVIDYRGYADNPGSPNETGLLKDARALWKYATETCNVDASRIVLFGESLGGGVAVGLAHEVCAAGTPPAGLIVRSTFSSLTDAVAHPLSLAAGAALALGSFSVGGPDQGSHLSGAGPARNQGQYRAL